VKGMFTGKPIPKEYNERWTYTVNNIIHPGNGIKSFIWKDRLHNLPEVEKLRQEALRIRKPINKRWEKLYDEVHLLVHIQGVVDGQRYYMDASGNGISFQHVYEELDNYDEIKYALDEDLPLYVGKEDKLSDRAIALVKDRLRGPKESGNRYAVEASIRNEFIKEYLYLENRFNTLNKIMGLCNFIMIKYVEDKYHHFYNTFECEDVLIDLKLNGHIYTYLFKPRGGFSLVRTPESSYYEDDGDIGEYEIKEDIIYSYCTLK